MEFKNETLLDHEKRIRKLEESDIKQQMHQANMEKNITELKFLVNENSREQQKALNEFTNRIIDTFDNDRKSAREGRFYQTKQFWAIASAVVTALVALLTKL